MACDTQGSRTSCACSRSVAVQIPPFGVFSMKKGHFHDPSKPALSDPARAPRKTHKIWPTALRKRPHHLKIGSVVWVARISRRRRSWRQDGRQHRGTAHRRSCGKSPHREGVYRHIFYICPVCGNLVFSRLTGRGAVLRTRPGAPAAPKGGRKPSACTRPGGRRSGTSPPATPSPRPNTSPLPPRSSGGSLKGVAGKYPEWDFQLRRRRGTRPVGTRGQHPGTGLLYQLI